MNLAEQGIEDVELTQEMVESLLRSYVSARFDASAMKKMQDRYGELIKAYLEKHPNDTLADEHGNTAKLQERHGGDVYETDRMPDDLVLALHRAGALSVNTALIKALGISEIADRVKPYKRPGLVTTALVVEEKR